MITPKKVDILADVLTSTDEGSFPGLAELSELLTCPVRQPLPEEERAAEESRTRKTPRKRKKATHYLSPEVSDGLDRILPRIRDMVPAKARWRVSKSQLVDSSLRLLLREFDEMGKESLLVRQFRCNDQDGNDS